MIDENQDLKLCPFCGGSAHMTEHFKKVMGWSLIHRCKVMGPLTIDYAGRSAEQVAAQWNTRA